MIPTIATTGISASIVTVAERRDSPASSSATGRRPRPMSAARKPAIGSTSRQISRPMCSSCGKARAAMSDEESISSQSGHQRFATVSSIAISASASAPSHPTATSASE
jgi:hypothetical protein